MRGSHETFADLEHQVARVVVERDPHDAAAAFHAHPCGVGQRDDAVLREVELETGCAVRCHGVPLRIRDVNEYSEQLAIVHAVNRNTLHAY